MMATATTQQRGSFWRKFAPLFGAGVIGAVSVIPLLAPSIKNLVDNPPAGATLPSLPILLAAQFGQMVVLTGVSVAIGLVLAPRLGLRSHIAEAVEGGKRLWSAIKPEVVPAAIGGAVAGVGIVALDVLFRPWMPAALHVVQEQPRGVGITLTGALYGGITEELLMRWGLMTVLAWLLWRVVQRGRGQPQAWLMWTAIAVIAVVFGVGHLGAMALITPLTTVVVARTVLLNAFGGLVFGWLYWRRSLEAAMIAHATTHVVMTLLSMLAVQFM